MSQGHLQPDQVAQSPVQSCLDTTVTGVQGESWGLKGLSSACCLHLDRSIITKALCCYGFLIWGLLNQRLAAILTASFVIFCTL